MPFEVKTVESIDPKSPQHEQFVVFTKSGNTVYLFETLAETKRSDAAVNGVIGVRAAKNLAGRDQAIIAHRILNDKAFWEWDLLGREMWIGDSVFALEFLIATIFLMPVDDVNDVVSSVIRVDKPLLLSAFKSVSGEQFTPINSSPVTAIYTRS